jgi:hypothetical protein
LAGYLVNLRAHAPAVRHDDIFIGQPQVGQLSADYETVRAPVDMEKSQSQSSIRLPGIQEKVKRPFWQDVEKVLQLRSRFASEA